MLKPGELVAFDTQEEASVMTVPSEVIDLMTKRGAAAYFGEPVSQLEHALQCAWLAARDASPRDLVIAALLHDIGHLLHDLPESAANHGIDVLHEIAGYEWILSRFGVGVAEPVRHHVAAKRYLCWAEPRYLESLSPASVQSLELQGGMFTDAEARQFEALPHYRDAVMLRRWDDRAKIAGLAVPELGEYREMLDAAATLQATPQSPAAR
jgi:gamma-butyrobetaine dioxygenase